MRVFPIAVASVALLISAPAAARSKDVISWGKAGVSFEQYRSDSLTCGRQGYYLDVTGTEEVAVFKAASRQLDNNETDLANSAAMGDNVRVMDIAASSARIVESVRPRERMNALRKMMEKAMTTCLSERGYHQFRLTKAQKEQLGQFKKGTPERFAYLHALSSNPTILADQGV